MRQWMCTLITFAFAQHQVQQLLLNVYPSSLCRSMYAMITVGDKEHAAAVGLIQR
jgi:hypothetical protein